LLHLVIRAKLSLCHGCVRIRFAGMVRMMRGSGVVMVWHMDPEWSWYGTCAGTGRMDVARKVDHEPVSYSGRGRRVLRG